MENNQHREQHLDHLMQAYKAACPEPLASPNFMPLLWQKIEAKRKAELWLVRWANVFAGAAATIALVTGLLFYQSPNPLPQRAYIEKLTDEINEDDFLESAYMAQIRPASYVQSESGGR